MATLCPLTTDRGNWELVWQAGVVRRALPWGLITLLALGVAAGAGLGATIPLSTPHTLSAARQITRFMAATRAAGTARFSATDIGASTNPALRSSGRQQGVVNFVTNSLRVSERDQSTGVSATGTSAPTEVRQDNLINSVWIGRTEYVSVDFGNLPADMPASSQWIKEATWPKNTFGPLGVLGQIDLLGQLSIELSARGLHLEDRGRAVVRGERTTAYEVIVVPSCPASKGRVRISPIELWVDGQGRLVQARSTEQVDITKKMVDHLPNGGDAQTGRIADVLTVQLGHFGARAGITAPPVFPSHGSGGSEFAEAKLEACV
jgi:hypothetical protein